MTRALALAAMVSTLAGCGYHLAGRNVFLPERIQVIGVPPLANETPRAELEQRISEQLLDEFLRRGFRTVAGRETANAVLEGAITGYHRVPVTFSARGRATRQEITITARVRLVESDPETILWSQENFVFRGQYDIEESEQEFFDREILAIEDIAEDFAESVVTSILEGF
jgi:outer membrane lipopolysaccharide assembly protein LptE/RlpB